MKCIVCGKNAESDYCFLHKSKKPLSVSVKEIDKGRIEEMRNFFLSLWKTRRHYSEVSGEYLGKEPLHTFFHHILEKNKYPKAIYDEENIVFLTLDEHSNVESDMYKYEEINERRNYLKTKYNL